MDDLRPGERVESVDFAPSRVSGGRRRGWSPLLLVGWAAVLAAVVGLGVMGEGSSSGGPGRIARGAPSPSTHPTSTPAPTPTPAPSRAPVVYTVAMDATGVTVHGAPVERAAVLVFISVQQPNGGVFSWRSISVEDPDGGIRPAGSTSFQVRLGVPASALGSPVVVEVTAYDNAGHTLGTGRTVIPVFGRGPIRSGDSLVR